MIKQAYLEEINSEQKTSKSGKNYTACSIKVDGKWYNGFGDKMTASWQQGMTIRANFYSEDYNGKSYLKFKTVGKIDLLEERMQKLETRFDKAAKIISELQAQINQKDLPFNNQP